MFEKCIATPPLALHQLVEVEEGGEVVLDLFGSDIDGDPVSSFLFLESTFWIMIKTHQLHA